uniref:Uncharacterized protein n=1 Tax=Arundo donax TaxID=35708 RepID=A0A0A9FUE1_ARUDO
MQMKGGIRCSFIVSVWVLVISTNDNSVQDNTKLPTSSLQNSTKHTANA